MHEGLTYLDDVTCSSCGNDLRIATDPAHKDDWVVDNKTVCHPCAERATGMRDEQERHKDETARADTHLFMDGRDFRVGPKGLYLPTTALEVTP